MKHLLKFGMYAAILSAVTSLPGFQNTSIDTVRVTIKFIVEFIVFLILFQFSKKAQFHFMKNVTLLSLVVLPLNYATEILTRHFVQIADAIPFVFVIAVVLLQGLAYILFGVSLSTLKEKYNRLVTALQVFFIIQGALFLTIFLNVLLPLTEIAIGVLLAILFFKMSRHKGF